MGDLTAPGTHCPSCSAAARPGAPWCTQCYAPLGAPAPPSRSAGPVAAAAAPAATAVAAPAPSALAPGPGATWPCSACGQRNDLAASACAGCATPFLAAVREERPALVLPVVGDLTALPPVRRVVVAVAVLVAFLVVTALLALLLA